MGLALESDKCIRESTDISLGVPVSANKSLQLELLVSEDERRRLQNQIFLLEDRLAEVDRGLEQYRAEASMNAQGLRRCVEERAAMASAFADLASHREKLEKDCALYEGDVGKLMESCDELARENEELQVQLKETTSFTGLVSEVETLREDKEHLRINLHRAEEEVKVLFKENTILEKENKRLLEELNRDPGCGGKHYTGVSPKRKRKSSPTEGSLAEMHMVIDFNNADSARQPLSSLQHNSPGTRLHKK